MDSPVTEPIEKEEEPSRGEITLLLEAWNNGDVTARDRLLALVYGELRRMAHRRLLGERAGHTMLTGTLVGEVYLRLSSGKGVRCQNHREFFAIAARLMRHALVDAARKRNSQQCGGGQAPVSLEDATLATQPLDWKLIAVSEALEILKEFDRELCEVTELHYFGGFTVEQTAELMEISVDQVKRRLRKARAHLHKILTSNEGASDGQIAMARN
ncbi:MAG: ECF-type sigma factor [Blastocatellales bacterium]